MNNSKLEEHYKELCEKRKELRDECNRIDIILEYEQKKIDKKLNDPEYEPEYDEDIAKLMQRRKEISEEQQEVMNQLTELYRSLRIQSQFVPFKKHRMSMIEQFMFEKIEEAVTKARYREILFETMIHFGLTFDNDYSNVYQSRRKMQNRMKRRLDEKVEEEVFNDYDRMMRGNFNKYRGV